MNYGIGCQGVPSQDRQLTGKMLNYAAGLDNPPRPWWWTMQSEPNTAQKPFHINVADRVKRLPPYLFGKINDLKYRKRRAGIDVIDLGMGNPTDVPDPQVIDKLLRGRPRRAQPPLLRQQRPATTCAARSPCATPAGTASSSTPTPKCSPASAPRKSSATCAWPCSGPGDTAIVPAPSFPIHVYAVALASGNVISLDCTQPDRFLSNVANVAEHLYPRPKVLILNYPHNPTHHGRRARLLRRRGRPGPASFGFMVIHDFAYGDVCFDGYQAPSFLSVPGAKEVGVETTTMSKGYNMAGWRLGFCAGNAEMVRALATIKGYYDYGIFQPIQIAGIIALRHGDELVERQALEYQKRRDVLVDGLRRIGWEVEPPKASMFVWAQLSRRSGASGWARSTSP